jgi:thiol-disulfide isomerase/thioredoxin
MLLRTLARRAATALAMICLAIACATGARDAASAGLFQPASALAPLASAKGWMNSPPLTPDALKGKVVLLDFWTYSCINCLRTLPYVRAWAAKYQPYGFVVIGVHTPEFSFERRGQNVQRATQDLAVGYPVVLDSDRAIWTASGVQGWPTLDFIDARGQRRHRQVGEGGYEQAERVIQQLLREAGRMDIPTDLVKPVGTSTQAAASALPAESEETYLGAAQASGFVATRGALRANTQQDFAPAARLRAEQWTLAGAWDVADEHVEARQAGTSIAYRFRARDVHLVLGPVQDGRPVRFRVRIDGQPPGADHGSDVDADGNGRVDVHRLYQLVRQADPRRERLFEIEFLEPGVRAYAFTFG